MEEKIISGSDKSCTVTVSGEVTRVRFEGSYLYIQVRHLSGEILCGRKPGIADGEDGTSKLTSGGICFDVASPVIYIGGNGVCEVYATNSEMLVFKDAPAVSGGGGESGITLTKLARLIVSAGTWTTPNALPTLPFDTWVYLILNSNYRTLIKLTDDVNGVYVAFPTLQASTPVAEFRFKLAEQASGEPKVQIYSTLSCTLEVYRAEGVVEVEN